MEEADFCSLPPREAPCFTVGLLISSLAILLALMKNPPCQPLQPNTEERILVEKASASPAPFQACHDPPSSHSRISPYPSKKKQKKHALPSARHPPPGTMANWCLPSAEALYTPVAVNLFHDMFVTPGAVYCLHRSSASPPGGELLMGSGRKNCTYLPLYSILKGRREKLSMQACSQRKQVIPAFINQ